MFTETRIPVVVAPMAGGPSTPELVAAVVDAGGFGFLGAGYLTADALAKQLAATRELTGEPFGVNLFVPGAESDVDISGYARRVRALGEEYGAEPGEPRWDDDDYPAKLDLLVAEQAPVVSFTFGLPSARDVDRLHEAGASVVITVTSPDEAKQATDRGADALCVQGFEAGGHRGTFVDDPASATGGEAYGLLALLRLVAGVTELPLIATGGIAHGADVAAVLVAGAVAAQCGSVFLDCPEAGTGAAHRKALADGTRPTAFTRVFSGRTARGMVNEFMTGQEGHAPAAYPQVHHLTRPVRAAAGRRGDPEGVNLWAGQSYPAAIPAPAADVVRRLHAQAVEAITATVPRLTAN